VKVRRANQQVVPEELVQRVAELTARVAELTRRVELYEGTQRNLALDQKADDAVRGQDDSSDPIEFITENGFSIVRPWESGKSPKPTGGRCRFSVSDGFIEREVTVEISREVVTEISLRTRGRIQLSNSFWISCAERHLANYVSERADFPDNDELIVERLDRQDILLALRWDRCE
jgi:hypothetical protein